MAIVSTKGLNVWLQKGAATPTELTVTAVSKAKPAVLTTTNTLAKGDVVSIPQSSTGFSELDGKVFVIGAATGTSLDLLGADTTASTGTFVAGTNKPKVYKAADFVKICASALNIDAASSSDISIGTFCDPSAVLPGNTTPGNIGIDGFIDILSEGYKELYLATDDNKARILKIDLPSNGYLLAVVTASSISFSPPLEGAATYSVSTSQTLAIRHLF